MEDEIRDIVDHDDLMEDIKEELLSGDSDEALERLEDLGYDVDDLDL